MNGTWSTGSAHSMLQVAVVTERRGLLHAQPRGAAGALARAGHQVAVLAVEDVPAASDPLTWLRYDVVLGRGSSDVLLTCLRAAEEAGVLVLNTSAAIAALRPRSVPTTGAVAGDVRVSGIGGRLHTVRLQPARHDGAAGGQPVPTMPALARLAVGTAAMYGLELYAVDAVLGPEGPVATAVRAFPDYRDVPGADELLATYVAARCRAELRPLHDGRARVPA
ncbi:MAG: hypothetical protein QOI54_3398 [Actinomycetota bacterium]|jgi:glutathione synthase/RimK-type ligase-like ATP-grasp enzyme|nr:hypothetical protein [Actinomycetota bacterium]